MIVDALVEAKAEVMALTSIPYQRSWAEKFQKVQLKQEVAGTLRIEGAVFSDAELDEALEENTPIETFTRSQRQARSAVSTYQWIASLPVDQPVTEDLVRNVHRLIVTGCDEDHCPPGVLRTSGENVVFGTPRHRGTEGGSECQKMFAELIFAMGGEFRDHDRLIQALAFHYHIGAMHPFLDGNGRTARAVEALKLHGAGLRDGMFIAMSNYYYDEKDKYLACLSGASSRGHDLTKFLQIGLSGIAIQCRRLRSEIQEEISKSLFRNVMFKLYGRLETERKRVIVRRQIELLQVLLERSLPSSDLFNAVAAHYMSLKSPQRALVRDLVGLISLGAVEFSAADGENELILDARLEWPTEFTETELYEKFMNLPEAKTHHFLQEVRKSGL